MANELEIPKGDDRSYLITITGTGVDAAAVVVFTMKKKGIDTAVVITKTSDNAGEIDNLTATTWQLNLVKADTNAASGVKPGSYEYDIEATLDGSGQVKTPVISFIKVIQDVNN